MDFAFAYILIAFVELAVKVAIVLVGLLSIFVVLCMARETWIFFTRQRCNGDRS